MFQNFKFQNFKFQNLNRGLAIAILSLTVGGAAIPYMASAQSNPTTGTPTIAQRQHRGDGWKQLNLTDAQKQQMKAIRDTTKQQVRGVLTTDQQAKLDAAGQSGDRKGVWKSLSLSADQKAQIRSIRKAAKEQSLAILTPEQRTKLEQMRAEHHRK